MGWREYVCRRYPNLQIGEEVRFEGGLYKTDREDLQRLIESRDYFNAYLFLRDSEQAQAAGETAPTPEPSKTKQGLRGSRA